jgi:hypothetical protein
LKELQAKINQAVSIPDESENELAEEQDCYQMLDETLVGQRRNLREREEILTQTSGVAATARVWNMCAGTPEN